MSVCMCELAYFSFGLEYGLTCSILFLFQDLLTISNMFLLDEVKTACVSYIKKLIDVENCINMKEFANNLGLTDLYSMCMTFIINNFR